MAEKKVTLKEVFSSDAWQITRISQGSHGMHRIDAKRRFRKPDVSSFFSEWGSIKYLNSLAREYVGKPLTEFSTYHY